MRSSFVATTGLKLARTPSARTQALRRRLAVAGALLALAAAGVVVGIATAPAPAADGRIGPLSYFPSE